MTYHLYCGIDFDHCEKGTCAKCPAEQRAKCEWEANHPDQEQTYNKVKSRELEDNGQT